MTFHFPPDPSVGQQVSNGAVYYEWDGVKWEIFAWPDPPPPDMPSIGYANDSQIGFNLNTNWSHIDPGYAALVRVRQDATLGALLDFHLANWGAAGSGAGGWSNVVFVGASGRFEGRYEMRAWNDGNENQGVLRFGDVAYGAYIWWDGTNYSLGSGMGRIWQDGGTGSNRGVRNSGSFNNVQMYYATDGNIHLAVDGTYLGYLWYTENFSPSNYWGKHEWGWNTFVKSNGQDITIYWDGANLQAFVGPTHVGQVFTTWNNTAVDWNTVVANMVFSVRLVWAGVGEGSGSGQDPFPGSVATGYGSALGYFRHRYLQFLRNNGWHTAPNAS